MNPYFWQLEAPWLQRTPAQPDAALGAAIWLWMHDLRHRKKTLQDMEHRMLAPIEAGQYVIARQVTMSTTRVQVPPHPLALLLFARFDARAEARYLEDPSQKIAFRDWQSGDRLWLIDWAAPFGHTTNLREPIMALLAGRGAKSICRSRDGVGTRVRLWQRPQIVNGPSASGTESRDVQSGREAAPRRKEPAHW